MEINSVSKLLSFYSSLSSSSASRSPLLNMGLSHSAPFSPIFYNTHSLCASHFTHTYASSGRGAFHATFADTRSLLQNTITPAVIGSATYLSSPLALQLPSPESYVSYFGSLVDGFSGKTVSQRDSKHSLFHVAYGLDSSLAFTFRHRRLVQAGRSGEKFHFQIFLYGRREDLIRLSELCPAQLNSYIT